jgi:two-component system chemotaxis sensor kinase CheA
MNMVLQFLLLPPELTDFERKYLFRVNRVALAFYLMHVPTLVVIAWLNHTRPLLAFALSSAVVLGPAMAYATFQNPRNVSVVHGVAAMFMGGLLVHFGQGPMQIEMHFYFFALVAMCAVFANPMVIVAAAVTVALHHLVVWLVLPASVFNYDASLWVVLVHAAFVVLESVATCFIARSFFDNVIGLEKIVEARTAEIDARNRDMRLLLDNVQQGFLTIDESGNMAQERSRAVSQWFPAPEANATWFDWLSKTSPPFGDATRVAWDEVVAGIMPLEITLDQTPHRLTTGGTHLNIEYRPISVAAGGARYLVVVTDVTVQVAHDLAEIERRESLAVFSRLLVDRAGFEAFFEDASEIVERVTHAESLDLVVIKRLVHTLKGNAGLYDLTSVASECHRIEDSIAETGLAPTPSAYVALVDRWRRLASDVFALVGSRSNTIELSPDQYADLENAVRMNAPREDLLRRIRSFPLEPTAKRLQHFAEQASRIAERLEKAPIRVHVEDHGVRLERGRWSPFWDAFIHVVRNAVDHGLEAPEVRLANGKRPEGSLALRTLEEGGRLIVEVEDDGRGIDWDAIADKAARLAVPVTSRSDLERVLFMEGVSTATAVTDLSGRGIGLGALLSTARALGGEIDVQSTPGKGTRIRVTFPLSPAVTAVSAPPSAAAGGWRAPDLTLP